MCVTAEDISATAASGVTGTTACATPPAINYCSLGTTDSHVVYYEYTVASTINTDLSIEIEGSGTATTDISIALYEDCAGTTYDNPETSLADGCTTLGVPLNYECVTPGTVLTIAVGSPEGSEGEFTITILEDNSETPINDGCIDAETINFGADCVFETVTTNNTGSCPEITPFDILSLSLIHI